MLGSFSATLKLLLLVLVFLLGVAFFLFNSQIQAYALMYTHVNARQTIESNEEEIIQEQVDLTISDRVEAYKTVLSAQLIAWRELLTGEE